MLNTSRKIHLPPIGNIIHDNPTANQGKHAYHVFIDILIYYSTSDDITEKQSVNTNDTNLESPLPRSRRRSEDQKSNRYKCHECTKTFSRPSSLRIHILSHTGEKPHVCPQPGCGRRFSVQSNMRRHLKVHYCSNTYQTFVIGKIHQQ